MPMCIAQAHGDWPNQVVYYRDVLAALADPQTCLNTSTARDAVHWLDDTNNITSPWWNTWVVFQVSCTDRTFSMYFLFLSEHSQRAFGSPEIRCVRKCGCARMCAQWCRHAQRVAYDCIHVHFQGS